MAAAEPLALIDHHAHGVITDDLDQTEFESLLTEAPGPPPPGATNFDSQLGFAVRRWCAPVLDLPPSAPAREYLARRAELGAQEVTRRLLRAAGVSAWLVDTGFQGGRLTTPAELADLGGAPARRIVRLETLAEQVLRTSGASAAGYAEAFTRALTQETSSSEVAGCKSIIAYRGGFGLLSGQRPDPGSVAAAAGLALRVLGAEPDARLTDEVLLRHLVWAAVDAGLPVQFHAGFGDPDARTHQANPSLLHDFLMATQGAGTPVMLLHCYPYHREAGYLANVFPHVYLDVGLTLNHVGARSAAVLAEALELTPFHKMLYSSDAFGLAELHYLGALGFRRDLAAVTGAFVADGAWSQADADRVQELIGSANAARVYRLGTP